MRNSSQPWICIRLTLSHADCRPDIGSALGSMLQESQQLLHNAVAPLKIRLAIEDQESGVQPSVQG